MVAATDVCTKTVDVLCSAAKAGLLLSINSEGGSYVEYSDVSAKVSLCNAWVGA